MTVKRGRKSKKHRGTRTAGWGLCHRGAGNRGGVGNAGSGKRAKCKMPGSGLWGVQKFGKHGFKHKSMFIIDHTINIRELEDKLDSFVKEKLVAVEKDVYVIDLPKIGFSKLLSAGKPTKKMKITVTNASKSVVEKIKAAGGEVILPKVEEKAAKGNA
jgi:large subunit ribosomal protein L15